MACTQTKPNMRQLSSKYLQIQKILFLQDIPETAQSRIQGGMFDAFTKVVVQADARGEF